MIIGKVNAYREAIIQLVVQGPNGQEALVEAVVDTGFTGYLTLPPSLVATLGLPWQRRGRAALADGSEVVFDVYQATVVWGGSARRIAADSADTEPLAGMSLLYGHELTMQVLDGGNVSIQEIKP